MVGVKKCSGSGAERVSLIISTIVRVTVFIVDKPNDAACFESIQSRVRVGEIFALLVC